ncbi:ABC transporter permease [Kribbella yunnanensis]|uniref:Autoinducer 2 import system permease protein LsrC n=1 Tax=Kribbella yunnanensis TaxID=190194 RepID=A0ABN2IK90_9ACTN
MKRTTHSLGEFSWIWLVTLAVFGLSALMAPGSVQPSSLVNMLPFAGILAIAAVGQTLVIQQRGLDLSVAGSVTLGGILVGHFTAAGYPVVLSWSLAVAATTVAGALSGVLVARLSITPLVATLAANALLLGAVRSVSSGFPVSASDNLREFARGRALGVPHSMLLALLFVVVAALVTRKTVAGRRFTAVGAGERAAEAAGVPAWRYQLGTYSAAGFCYGTAGILLTGFIGSASPDMGNGYLLPVITAVVVGGTPFTGGRGSVVASAVAALFMTQLSQLALSLGVPSSGQLLLQASVLVLAVAVRRIPFRILRSGWPRVALPVSRER